MGIIMDKSKLYVVGIGPGDYDMMTGRAIKALGESDVIVGYQVYTALVKDYFPNKEFMTTPMRQEVERCRLAINEASTGKTVSMISSGDAGIYGMAGLIYEVYDEMKTELTSKNIEIEIQVIAGVTAANGGAAYLGAPLMHDFALISLSDLMTPWELIEKRLMACAGADMGIVLYNPSSHKRHDYLEKACDILLRELPSTRICGLVENIDRDETYTKVCTLGELRDMQVNMFTTVYIGNSQTRKIGEKMVTPRGYHI
jgi:precorrin-3B C17-methyltransferase